jgi:RNA polymerase sigma-70 factor (ECF subfamily)
MNMMGTTRELERLWHESSARLRAWFERETGNAADADDLVQETFVRVHERLDTLTDAASLRAWVGRIARNALIDHLRRRARRSDEASAAEDVTELPEHGRDPATRSVERDSAERLERTVAGWLDDFLARLAPEDAAALRLVDLEGRTQAELAAANGLSLSGAKSRVQRARAKLRADLEQCCAFAFDARGGLLEARRRADGCAIEGCGDDCGA